MKTKFLGVLLLTCGSALAQINLAPPDAADVSARQALVAGGADLITTSPTGLVMRGVAADLHGNRQYQAAWFWSATARQSVAMSPTYRLGSDRDAILTLISRNDDIAYTQRLFFRSAGDSYNIGSNPMGTKVFIYTSFPFVRLSGAVTLQDGDVLTDGLGASGVAIAHSGSNPSVRWITGNRWFTLSATLSINGIPSGRTFVSNSAFGYGGTDGVYIYRGMESGTDTDTLCIWNNTDATRFGTIRIER